MKLKKIFTKQFLKSNAFKVLLTVLIVMTALLVVPIQFENDTFYMIQIGEDIMKGNMNYIDNYSIHADLFYYFPHFLFDIIVYLIYCIDGFRALYIALVLLTVGIGFFSYFVCHKFTKNKVVALLLAIITLIGIHPFIAMRSQILSFYLFLWEVYSIQMFLNTDKKRYLVYLVIIPILLANVHLGVWPLYFVLYLPFLITNIKFKFGKIENKKYKNLYYLFIPIVLSLATPLLTPSGIKAYQYFIANMTSTTMLGRILEHQPPTLSLTMGKFLFAFLFVIILMFINTDKKIYTKDLALVTGLSIMALMSRRHIALLVLLSLPFLSSFVLNMYEDTEKERKMLTSFLTRWKYLVTVVILLGIFGFGVYFIKDINSSYFVSPNYPIEAAKYIKENYDVENIRMYNDYNIGSYLLLEDIPVFIDSRADVYDTKFNDNTRVLTDYFRFKDGDMYYQDFIDRYNLDLLLIRKDSSYLMNMLNRDTQYKKAYEDNNYIIYERLNDE